MPSYLTDVTKQPVSLIQIGAGIEKRKEEARFRGYCGGQLMIT